VVKLLAPGKIFQYGVEIGFAAGVIIVGRLLVKRMIKSEKAEYRHDAAEPSIEPEKNG
jgi:hypothetical protein